MDPTDGDTMTRWGPSHAVAPGGSVGAEASADRALLDAAVASLVAENAAKAARLDAVSAFHERRVHEAEAGDREGLGYFMLTPLQATQAELGPLLVMSDLYLQTELEAVDDLKRSFPRLWRQCRAGRLDIGRARVAQAHLAHLLCDDDRAAYAERVEAYVERQDDPAAAIHPVGYTNLQRAARRACLRLPQKSPEETFSQAFSKRRVRLRTDEDNGMAVLTCTTAVTDALRADYRLTLIAKKRAEVVDEERTIEQLRADTLVELVMGRLTVKASDSSLEDPDPAVSPDLDPSRGPELTSASGDPPSIFEWHTVGRFARPIVNVTVPWTTLAGLGDSPGRLAGGASVPAELARIIGADPQSTWYRLLTDPDGGFRELSTQSYEPTEAIWRWAVAEHPECVWPTCRRPSTVVELDHRQSYPEGDTSTSNLQPLCARHHRVKHSQGFSVVRDEGGAFLWTSRFGLASRKAPWEYPSGAVAEGLAVGAASPLEAAVVEVPEAAAVTESQASFVARRFAALIASAA